MKKYEAAAKLDFANNGISGSSITSEQTFSSEKIDLDHVFLDLKRDTLKAG